MVAPVGIGAWNWLSADVVAGEAAGAGEMETGAVGNSPCVVGGKAGIGAIVVSKTDAAEMGADEIRPVGAGETEAEGAENCVGAVGLCTGTLENE
jgi:hypothetical protein